ncbi:indole-3-glycerol phosphate synthase [Marinicella pacifica]|jgi:indole-3-glycerol phosphate synthase|uniref:Indole-3-glycerol phosphate synthase n=1 Tax=Marinicella pacifica TaxID=1171543 RepID=A0A917FN96_9GAMM|nr:indole-3-glycerol phosphate synthase TrpC [Marinicella pacifica]GGF94086.1 indole-3-glycerol phosphate synthase [Marinicella pacifica]
MADRLAEIMRSKSSEVTALKATVSVKDLEDQIQAFKANEQFVPRRYFIRALQDKIKENKPAVIAEVKKASPSKGVIREDFDPKTIALNYQQGGAACLSVLTDTPYFQGHDDYLMVAKQATDLPVLRKDFIIDPWQIYQSKALGADCILLIVACLSDADLMHMTLLAQDLEMDVLMEVHDEEELQRALKTPTQLIGINNRNLKTFETDIATSERLVKHMDEGRLVVSESGIGHHEDITRLQAVGIHCFLVGESLMRQPQPGVALQELMSG